MRYIRYAFWAIVAVCLVLVGLANSHTTELHAMPGALADLLGISPTIEMPVYLVIFIGVAIGLLIGFLWEWLREYKHRATARAKAREVRRLEQEIGRMQAEKHEGKDEVLALLEGAESAR